MPCRPENSTRSRQVTMADDHLKRTRARAGLRWRGSTSSPRKHQRSFRRLEVKGERSKSVSEKESIRPHHEGNKKDKQLSTNSSERSRNVFDVSGGCRSNHADETSLRNVKDVSSRFAGSVYNEREQQGSEAMKEVTYCFTAEGTLRRSQRGSASFLVYLGHCSQLGSAREPLERMLVL